MANIIPYKNILPKIGKNVFIANNATIIGDVEIEDDVSIWFGVVIRGDVAKIKIGKATNIQDGTIIHVSRFDGPTTIGQGVTIGHLALIHACTIEDNSFIGMGAIVMDNAVIKKNSMVAAGAMVTNNKIVESGELWAGRPAKFFRSLSEEEIKYIKTSEENYTNLAKEYL